MIAVVSVLGALTLLLGALLVLALRRDEPQQTEVPETTEDTAARERESALESERDALRAELDGIQLTKDEQLLLERIKEKGCSHRGAAIDGRSALAELYAGAAAAGRAFFRARQSDGGASVSYQRRRRQQLSPAHRHLLSRPLRPDIPSHAAEIPFSTRRA